MANSKLPSPRQVGVYLSALVLAALLAGTRLVITVALPEVGTHALPGAAVVSL